MNIIDQTCALVITYNPEINQFLKNLDIISKEFKKVFIIDNSTNEIILDSHLKTYLKLSYIKIGRNIGIAEAQNIGIKEAKVAGFAYICEFDQDTLIPEGFAHSIINSYFFIRKNIDENIIGVSPSINAHNSHSMPIKVSYTLSSGFFYSIETIDLIGYKQSDLFIDLVDWLWCMKATHQGKTIYQLPYLKLKHSLGEGRLTFLGIPKPFRHYYAFRNYIYTIKLDYVPLSWKLKYFLINLSKIIIYPFIMDNGFLRLKFMLKGIFDGLRGKMGEIDG